MEIKSPLAQSFYIVPTSGIFATSVDLYFYSKDQSQSVTVQLRPMKLGIPDSIVYPESEVTLYPEDINVSSDATLATTFKFPSPVYLSGGTYHAMVVVSNSSDYKVWASRLGELDSSSLTGQVDRVANRQIDSGSLFLSQSGSTWTANQYDDLKYTLRRAEFNTGDRGVINFYNSNLDSNENISLLNKDSLQFLAKKVRVGLSKTVVDVGLTFGNTVIQQVTNATGNFVGYGASAFGNLTIIDDGQDYEDGTYSNVPLISLTGTGRNATVNITISSGVVVSSGATITSGGVGYKVGDLLTIDPPGTNGLGRNIKLSVSSISGYNELIIDQVQGNFETGVGKTIRYTNSSGVTLDLNGNGSDVLLDAAPVELSDGRHIKVNHYNHGMHSGTDLVKISNATSDVAPTTLVTQEYGTDATADISLTDASKFSTFEGLPVSATNLGYILIGEEIISYNEVSGNLLRGISRSIDGTRAQTYEAGVFVYKYELNGISLRRINKTHQLSDATVSEPIGLDYYNIKLLLNSSGKDRTTIDPLYIKESKSAGGDYINATRNIQYSVITPNMEIFSPPTTEVRSSVRTVSGKSIDGLESAFLDQGFEDIVLNAPNYLNSNRVIASKLNEDSKLSTLPGSKSLNLNLSLASANNYLSPVISAIERSSVILTTNRIDNKITDISTDDRVSTLKEDPSSFVYATKPVVLENPAQTLKVILSAYVNIYSDIKLLYCVSNNEDFSYNYFPFPGYSNLIDGVTIDTAKNDGTPDNRIIKTDILVQDGSVPFVDCEFTAESIGPFKSFSIKIIGTSTNQTYPPRVRDLRVIALA
jgi:hypothetical protein